MLPSDAVFRIGTIRIHKHRHGWWFVSDKFVGVSQGYRNFHDATLAQEAYEFDFPYPKFQLDLWEDGECKEDLENQLLKLTSNWHDPLSLFWKNFKSACENMELDYALKLLAQGELCKIWLPKDVCKSVYDLVQNMPGWDNDIIFDNIINEIR